MFDTLIASRPNPRSSVSSRTVLLSVGIHGFLFAGALYASTLVPAEVVGEEMEETVAYLDLDEATKILVTTAPVPPRMAAREEAPPKTKTRTEDPAPAEKRAEKPARARSDAPGPDPVPSVAKGFQELAMPTAVAAALPEIAPDLQAVRPEDFGGVGVPGGIATGFLGGERRNLAADPLRGTEEGGDGEPVDIAIVEERPRLLNDGEVKRVLQRLYPPRLREAGVTGQTLLRLVIGTDGRVESSSVTVVSTTHDSFAEASTKVVERFKFRPAKINGKRVRVTVSIPIVWTLQSA